ncbi:hypothetical protein B0H17DRAFT_1030473 [Mycena rosella]|uniref:Transmembrane protein n=1 Tax=Mycena rosella TaxID=1033263 RepID=A0AAD7MAY3_MYCRO|nr:hypothetical protein B0H17DRAFT_1030473 [Mycena rosella]
MSRPSLKKFDVGSFLLGVLTGVLLVVAAAVGWIVWSEPFKIWIATTIASFHLSFNTVILCFISLNLGILNVVVFAPRLSVLSTIARKLRHPARIITFHKPTTSHSATPDLAPDFGPHTAVVSKLARRRSPSIAAVWIPLSVYCVQLLRQAASSSPTAFAFVAAGSQDGTVVDDAVEEAQVIGGRFIQAYDTIKDTLHLVLGSCIALFHTIWPTVVGTIFRIVRTVTASICVVGSLIEDAVCLVLRFCARVSSSFCAATVIIARTIKRAVCFVLGFWIGSFGTFLPITAAAGARTVKGALCLVLGFFIKLSDVFWSSNFSAYAIVCAYLRVHDKTIRGDDRSVQCDDADTTLVDEGGSQSSDKDSKDTSTSLSARIRLSSPQSAPVSVSWLGGHSALRRSVSCQLSPELAAFIVPAVPVDTATLEPSVSVIRASSVKVPQLKPSMPAFVPTIRSTAVIPATQDIARSTEETSKEQWEPSRPLTFAWARGGCPVRITAPPPAVSPDVSAPAFVPRVKVAVVVDEAAGRAGLSASMWALTQVKAATPAVDEDAGRAGLSASMWAPTPVAAARPAAPLPAPVKNQLVLRSARPSFWSPGGCEVRIVAPSSSK